MTRNELMALGPKGWIELIRDGHPIDPAALDDTGYRGIALGLPETVEKLTWKTFQKTFHRDPKTGELRGWNVRVEQRGLDAPTQAKVKDGRPWTFGHYRVVAADEPIPRIGRTRGLLIHYGLGRNAPLYPMRRIRDPIVAVEAGSVELLLGWSYVDLGPLSVGTPSFFSLEREGPLAYVPE